MKLIDTAKAKTEFKIEARQSEADILLYGAVGDDFWEDSVSAKSFSDELKVLPESVKKINLRINSPGGSVFDGVTIYERLRQHKAKVTVHVDGMAASIASIIALAGDEVIIGEGAFFMVHAPMSGVMGNAREMEDMIEVLDKIEAQMTGIYSRKTGLSSAEISRMLMKDTWLNAEEAVEMGFADRISDNDESQMRVAASLIENANWIKSRPNMKTRDAMAREKVKDFKNNIKEFLARK